jgi:hypothetical protein
MKNTGKIKKKHKSPQKPLNEGCRMILVRAQKNYAQAHASRDPLRGCWNQTQQVLLEVGETSARSGRVHVKVDLMEGCRSSFKQSIQEPHQPRKNIQHK